MDKTHFNKDCPVCLESTGEMLILSCLHRIHESCAEGLTDLSCPMCRKEVINWPSRIKAKIEANSRDREQELVEEDTAALLEQQAHARAMMSQMTMFLQPPPQIEIMSALQYLADQGIPMHYIPQRVRIARQRNQPRVQPGVLFTTIVGQVMEKVQEDLTHGTLQVERDHPEEDDSSGDESSDDDPFELENDALSGVNRSVNFVEIDD